MRMHLYFQLFGFFFQNIWLIFLRQQVTVSPHPRRIEFAVFSLQMFKSNGKALYLKTFTGNSFILQSRQYNRNRRKGLLVVAEQCLRKLQSLFFKILQLQCIAKVRVFNLWKLAYVRIYPRTCGIHPHLIGPVSISERFIFEHLKLKVLSSQKIISVNYILPRTYTLQILTFLKGNILQ